MSARVNPHSIAPEVIRPMLELEASLADSGLEHSLLKLVKMRASQINGCGYCLHMHSREARGAGESEERLYLLGGWRESSLYTDRERAALAWTDSLTLLAQTGAPDADYDGIKPHFSDEEIVKLTLAIGAINVWNRIAVGFRSQHPRTWKPMAEAA